MTDKRTCFTCKHWVYTGCGKWLLPVCLMYCTDYEKVEKSEGKDDAV